MCVFAKIPHPILYFERYFIFIGDRTTEPMSDTRATRRFSILSTASGKGFGPNSSPDCRLGGQGLLILSSLGSTACPHHPEALGTDYAPQSRSPASQVLQKVRAKSDTGTHQWHFLLALTWATAPESPRTNFSELPEAGGGGG